MKRTGYGSVFLLAAVLLVACKSSPDETVAGYVKEQEEIMDTMMKAMEEVPDFGSAELDFLDGMIPHHRAAVQMAESYLNYAEEDAEFRQLAETIIQTQNEEIRAMETMIEQKKGSIDGDPELEAAYLKEYRDMMNTHKNHSVNLDSLDGAFAEGMSLHHQMAIDMAQTVIKYAKDKEILRFAGQIIEVQKDEIGQMKNYLDSSDETHH